MEKTYMNPNTGSVDTMDGWGYDLEEALAEGLVEVVRDSNGDWIKA